MPKQSPNSLYFLWLMHASEDSHLSQSGSPSNKAHLQTIGCCNLVCLHPRFHTYQWEQWLSKGVSQSPIRFVKHTANPAPTSVICWWVLQASLSCLSSPRHSPVRTATWLNPVWYSASSCWWVLLPSPMQPFSCLISCMVQVAKIK